MSHDGSLRERFKTGFVTNHFCRVRFLSLVNRFGQNSLQEITLKFKRIVSQLNAVLWSLEVILDARPADCSICWLKFVTEIENVDTIDSIDKPKAMTRLLLPSEHMQ